MTRQIINPWTWQDQVGFVLGHAVGGGGRTIYRFGPAGDGSPLPPELHEAPELWRPRIDEVTSADQRRRWRACALRSGV